MNTVLSFGEGVNCFGFFGKKYSNSLDREKWTEGIPCHPPPRGERPFPETLEGLYLVQQFEECCHRISPPVCCFLLSLEATRTLRIILCSLKLELLLGVVFFKRWGGVGWGIPVCLLGLHAQDP